MGAYHTEAVGNVQLFLVEHRLPIGSLAAENAEREKREKLKEN
jgi:hypothetical protein